MSDGILRATALDHVGIAVDSVDTPLAALLGSPSALVEMASGVSVGRFGPAKALELVTASRPGSPVERFLERRGPGLHHIGLRVDRPLAELMTELEAAGFAAVGEIAASSDGRPSLFLHPATTGGVLIELVEGPPSA